MSEVISTTASSILTILLKATKTQRTKLKTPINLFQTLIPYVYTKHKFIQPKTKCQSTKHKINKEIYRRI